MNNQDQPFPIEENQVLENFSAEKIEDQTNDQPSLDQEITSTESNLEEVNPLAIDSSLTDEGVYSLTETKEDLTQEIEALQIEKQTLKAEIEALQIEKNQLLEHKIVDVQAKLQQIVETSLEELQQEKQALEIAVEKLERRRDKIQAEMRTSFAGVSQDLAIRVQGFKDYLVGSLQDLAAAAEQLELPNMEKWETTPSKANNQSAQPAQPTQIQPQFSQQNFVEERRKVKEILEQYRTRPDYYGPPWQLRRTFEPIHAERVQNWFFAQGGRGAIKSMGSRLQNILIASAVMSVTHKLYGNRVRTLVLANTPERLGEWRRGLQDCLGISRSDFGPERGVVLFEQPEALIQKADRLVEDKLLPLVIIDETEDNINLSLLQFPLWLAFAPEPQPSSNYFY